MAKINENEVLTLIQRYYNGKNREVIISGFLNLLEDCIQGEKRLQKARLTETEEDSEAVYALLQTFEVFKDADSAVLFKETFLQYLRPQLRKFSNTRSFVDIEEVSIPDGNPNPEEAYILKEQIGLVRDFLQKRYDRETIDMFMRKFADGETYKRIAKDYSISHVAVVHKLRPVLKTVRLFMERMNES